MAGFFANLTPLFAAIMSTVFLGDLPQIYHLVAFGLIVSGILVSSRRSYLPPVESQRARHMQLPKRQ